MSSSNAAMIAAFGIMAAALATVSGRAEPVVAKATNHDPKVLVAERCSKCHDIAIISGRRASPEEWRVIIERMIANGAQVSQSEAEAIVSYLANPQAP